MFEIVDVRNIPIKKRGKRNVVYEDVSSFFDSGAIAAKVDIKKYKTVSSASSSYRAAIKRNHLPIIVMKRGDELYLIRSDLHAE